jgi:hypothetical protein
LEKIYFLAYPIEGKARKVTGKNRTTVALGISVRNSETISSEFQSLTFESVLVQFQTPRSDGMCLLSMIGGG